MSIKFKSKLSEIEVDGKIVQNKHRVIKHTDTVQDLVVAVITKTVAHPEYGNGSASGFTIDEVEGAYLEFTQGITYKFDQSDSTNSGHPLLFYYESDKTTPYSTGVTTSGTPGTSGAYTQIVVNETTPAVLYYQCSAHSLMGSYVKFGTRNLTGFSITADEASSIGVNVKNKSGGSLSAGTVVHASPSANPPGGNVIEVVAANNSSSATMPAIGVLKQALEDEVEGIAIAFGKVSNLNTSSFSEGDSLYVNSSGGFTTTKPTGSALIQKIGIVAKVHASNGTIEVFGANRTNDVPNITENYIWLGNASGVAIPTLHNISNISDVNITNLADNQILKYDSSTSKWVNEADISGSGASNSFETIAVTGQSSVVADSSTDTLTLAAGSNVTLTTDAGTDTITIASSGGGGGSDTGTVTIEKDVFDSAHATDPTDGSNTTFDLTSAPAGKNNLQVYVDGVYQAKENFSLSGSTITISPAPPSGVELEVIHIKAITGQITLDKFDGNNSTTAFPMSQSIDNENNLQVYINGVYQSKDTYSTSGSTLTLTTAPATGAKVEVVHIKPVDVTSLSSDVFTGNGVETAYDLTATPSAAAKTLVFIQGVYQEKSTYSISSNTVTFTAPPPDGYTIEVNVFGRLAISENTVTVERFTGSSTETSFVLASSPSANNVDVYISGLYQNKNSYTYSAGTITFDEAPDTGAVVEAKYIANITQVVAADNDFYKFQWVSTAQTADFTAVANRGYFVDTSSSAISVTLPASPNVGDTVNLIDYAGNSGTNSITITSSNNIMGSTADTNINYDNGAVEIVYSGSAKGWVVAAAANETANALSEGPLEVDYLVIAGGGGGGYNRGAGGGGAGGYRTSYGTGNISGGNSSVESTLSLLKETNYTVTVGTGGAGGGSPTDAGSNGTNSVFSTITSTGGGGGGGGIAATGTGKTGGSGGGGANYAANFSNGGSGTSNQGFAGGNGNSLGATSGQEGGVGGGGAGGAGGSVSTLGDGGDGGSGQTSSITGTPVARAGGGSGSSNYTGGSAGTAVAGGGAGRAKDAGHGNADNGADNKGGGGGSHPNQTITGSGGNGGSGVVILRYLDSFTISETTNPSVLTFSTDSSSVQGYKITTFTAGTNGTIKFS
jgi:hypothetical protein